MYVCVCECVCECHFDIHRQLCLDFDIETLKFLIIHKSSHVTNLARKGGREKIHSYIELTLGNDQH